MDMLLKFNDRLEFDIGIQGALLESGGDLQTAVLLSIFSDRRAMPDDETPGSDKGGWWADDVEGSRWGSRRWLLERAKQTDEVLKLDRDYVKECLKWLVSDGVSSGVEVSNEWVPNRMGVERMLIEISKPDGTVEAIKFDFAWREVSNAV